MVLLAITANMMGKVVCPSATYPDDKHSGANPGNSRTNYGGNNVNEIYSETFTSIENVKLPEPFIFYKLGEFSRLDPCVFKCHYVTQPNTPAIIVQYAKGRDSIERFLKSNIFRLFLWMMTESSMGKTYHIAKSIENAILSLSVDNEEIRFLNQMSAECSIQRLGKYMHVDLTDRKCTLLSCKSLGRFLLQKRMAIRLSGACLQNFALTGRDTIMLDIFAELIPNPNVISNDHIMKNIWSHFSVSDVSALRCVCGQFYAAVTPNSIAKLKEVSRFTRFNLVLHLYQELSGVNYFVSSLLNGTDNSLGLLRRSAYTLLLGCMTSSSRRHHNALASCVHGCRNAFRLAGLINHAHTVDIQLCFHLISYLSIYALRFKPIHRVLCRVFRNNQLIFNALQRISPFATIIFHGYPINEPNLMGVPKTSFYFLQQMIPLVGDVR